MIVTSFGQKGYHTYGKRFIESFLKHWPEEEHLTVYYERALPSKCPQSDRLHYINLFEYEDFLMFMDVLNRSDPLYSGMMKKGPEGGQSYNFRYDAHKFFRKVYAMCDAGLNCQDTFLTWIDADVETHSDVPKDFIKDMYEQGDGNYIVHLDRDWSYSETGFVAFNTQHDMNESFMKLFLAAYFNGSFKYLGEFHDCYVFDFIRKLINVPCKSITEDAADRYLFDSSVLGKYMRHDKGPERKAEIQEKIPSGEAA